VLFRYQEFIVHQGPATISDNLNTGIFHHFEQTKTIFLSCIDAMLIISDPLHFRTPLVRRNQCFCHRSQVELESGNINAHLNVVD
jgi:hypothetical protein